MSGASVDSGWARRVCRIPLFPLGSTCPRGNRSTPVLRTPLCLPRAATGDATRPKPYYIPHEDGVVRDCSSPRIIGQGRGRRRACNEPRCRLLPRPPREQFRRRVFTSFGVIDRSTFGACSRLEGNLYACHHRLVNGYRRRLNIKTSSPTPSAFSPQTRTHWPSTAPGPARARVGSLARSARNSRAIAISSASGPRP